MKIKIFYPFLAVLTAMVFFSCASREGETVNISSDYQDVPSFYLEPPKADESIYGVGVAKTERLDLSKKLAVSRARDDIAFQISLQVQASIVDYAQEGGEGTNSQLISFIETVSRQITETTLAGTTVEKLSNAKDGTIYALVSFPKANILKEAEAVFSRNEDAAFAEFKAQEALNRLDIQLENNPTNSVPITQ